MNWLRHGLASGLSLSMVVGLALPGVAQSEDAEGAVAHVTGTTTDADIDASEETTRWDDDVYVVRDMWVLRDIEWSDPRLPSKAQWYANADEYMMPGTTNRPGMLVGLIELTGPDGMWAGTFEEVTYLDGRAADGQAVLTGQGDYESLFAVLYSKRWYDADNIQWEEEWEGLIFEGEPPPFPEPSAE